jgi:hypothetical protein
VADNDAKIVIGADVAGAMAGIDRLQAAMPAMAAQIAAGFSIAAVTAFTKAAIDAADELNDLSQKLGISVETLAGFKLVAEQSGTTVEAMGNAIKKLSTYMVDNRQKLEDVGITAKTADGALLQLSELFATMPDGIQKTALATELFGKAGLDMIPVLNQGSAALGDMIEKGQELNPITAEMAKNADAFNDTLGEMRLRANSVAISLADELLKSLVPLIEEMNKATLSGDGMARTFGSGIAEAFRAVLVLGSEVAFVFRGVGTEIGGIAAQISAVASGDFAKAGAIGDLMKEDAANARAEQDAHIARLMGANGGASGGGERVINPASEGKAAKLTAGKTAKPKKEKAEKESNWIAGDYDAMGMDSEAEQAKAIESERVKQERITEEYQRGMAQRWEQLQIDNMSRDDLELSRYEAKLAEMEVLRGNEFLTEQQHQEMLAKVQIDAAMKSSSTQMQIAAAQASWEKMSAKQKTEFMLSQALSLTAGFALHSKTAFEINKKLSIAQATMTTYDNAVKAFNAYASIPYVGPVLGAVAAAGAIAFGMAQVSQIKSQQFGGGGASGAGSIPSMPSYSASRANSDLLEGGPTPTPVSIAATQGVAETARTQVNVTLVGTAFDYKTITNELIPLLNEASANGAEIRVMQGA